MALKHIIEALEAADPNHVVRFGFRYPMSYRGDYCQIAFAPAENVTVASMLTHAKSALGATFNGYEGGEFTMDEWTDCYINVWGESGGDRIGPTLLKYMLTPKD